MLFSFLENTNEIAIIAHKNPDLDTLCAAQSLYNIINQALTTHLICIDEIPKKYETIINTTIWKKEVPNSCRKIITLDCSNWERTGLIQKQTYKILNFDHHNTNTNFGNYNYVIKDSSSTCEMLAEVIFRYKINISVQTATLLLTGIYDDTESLKLPNTSSKTFKICKELIYKGANILKTKKNIKPVFTSDQLKKIGEILMNTYLNKSKVAICLQNGNHSTDHQETIVKLIDQIPNTKFSMLLTRNHQGLLRASLRSNQSKTDVSLIAKKYGGGGHKNAAGFICNETKISSLR